MYFRNLVAEIERRRGEEMQARRGIEMGVRVVGRQSEEEDRAQATMSLRGYGGLRNRAGSAE